MHGGVVFLSSTVVWLYNLIENVTPRIYSGDEFEEGALQSEFNHMAADRVRVHGECANFRRLFQSRDLQPSYVHGKNDVSSFGSV